MTANGRRAVRFTPAAADDLDSAFAYVSEHDVAAAYALLSRLQQAVDRLADFPDMGVTLSPEEFELVTPGVRFIVVEPYVVFYRAADAAIVVLRILHSRRDFLSELLG
jgi:toxin ParE1/3/4